MRHIALLLFLNVFVCSCVKKDRTSNVCVNDCTIVQGQVVTQNNIPVSNVLYTLTYNIYNPPFYSEERKLAEGKSDNSGNYKFSFYLKNDELGDSAKGGLQFRMNVNSVDSNKYIVLDAVNGFSIYSISRRDTIINASFYIPTKAFIKVNVKNFNPANQDDFFQVITLFPYGLNIGDNGVLPTRYRTGTIIQNVTSLNPTPDNIQVASNETNIVRVFKRKNNVSTYQDTLIFIPANNKIQLTYEY